MLPSTRAFATSESGAVSVDFVVLTAGLCTLGLVAALVVTGGIQDLSNDISVAISEARAEAAEEDETPDEVFPVVDPEVGAEEPAEDVPMPTATAWNGLKAGNYYGMGAVAAPGNTGVDRTLAIGYAAADAPAGFNFDTPLFAPWSNSIVYTSNDGAYFSIDGVVYPAGDGGSYQQSQWTAPPVVAWNGS